jgi:hypothetical protein
LSPFPRSYLDEKVDDFRRRRMNWEVFLQHDRIRKQAVFEHLQSSISLVPEKHRAIWKQLMDDHQQHIVDIDAMIQREKRGAATEQRLPV